MIDIIYEDTDLIVVHKKAGVAVQNARIGQKDIESMLKTYIFEKEGKSNPYLGIIHRLDQPVQGLVVFAKNQKSASCLSKQVQDGKMKKYYTAVVCGCPDEEEKMLTHSLKKNGQTNLSEVVPEKTAGAKKAMLRYQVLKKGEEKTLLFIELFTGRHHQIRVQMAAEEMPIYGDQKYNKNAKPGERIALCASMLVFSHPSTGKTMRFNCEPSFLEMVL